MDRLPLFNVDDYLALISALRSRGFEVRQAVDLASPPDRTDPALFIRHDVDLFLTDVDRFAAAEAEQGFRSTYYILLTGTYNPRTQANARVIRSLADLGHDVGLHYDLTIYPPGIDAARRRLSQELAILEDLSGAPVRTLSMHQPHLGTEDLFLDEPGLVNPSNPRWHKDLLYVSDSCRAWRDETLLTSFGAEPPRRLLLTTHPELWLNGTILDRHEYLMHELVPRATMEARVYLEQEVTAIWSTHKAPRAHDQREARRSAL